MRRVHPIEAESYRILRELVDLSRFGPLGRAVAERVIHASADLEYAESLVLNEAALEDGLEALRRGALIVTDVSMVAAGITRWDVRCFISDSRTKKFSEDLGITRSASGFRIAATEIEPGAVWVVGNAPTALFELMELDIEPALIVGLPVGFVGAAESKEALLHSGLPAIANRGSKGGSAIAAAAVNALIYMLDERSPAPSDIPQLGYFVLDVLRYVEQIPSVLNLLNNTGSIRWREFWDRNFERDEVREVLEYLAERGLVVPHANEDGETQPVPVDVALAKQMNDEDLWWLLDECGEEAWRRWDDYPTSE